MNLPDQQSQRWTRADWWALASLLLGLLPILAGWSSRAIERTAGVIDLGFLLIAGYVLVALGVMIVVLMRLKSGSKLKLVVVVLHLALAVLGILVGYRLGELSGKEKASVKPVFSGVPDFERYCKEKYDGKFEGDASEPFCRTGDRRIVVEPKEICDDQFGSTLFDFDGSSLTLKCDTSGHENDLSSTLNSDQ